MMSEVKTYCIIGDPIEQSLSPIMHNSAFNTLGIKSSYISFRVPKSELKNSIESLRAVGIAGFNVTIPHKIEILRYLDELDPSAVKTKAVNTVKNVNGRLIGYNTDIYGFIKPLQNRKINFSKMKILILGAGGAAYAVTTALSYERGIFKTVIINRSVENAFNLAKHATSLGLKCCIKEMDKLCDVASESDLIVNTTSVGLKEEQSLINYECINHQSIVYDIVYKPVMTNLLENAKIAGATIVYGYEMLLYQGAQAFKIWTGIDAPIDAMKKSLFGIFEPL